MTPVNGLTGVENESRCEFCYWNALREQSVLECFSSSTSLQFLKIMVADLVGTAEKVGKVITAFLFGDNKNCSIVFKSNINK